MQEKIERRLIAVFVVIAMILAGISAAALRNIGRSMETGDWVNHTHAVILEAEAIQSSLNAGEAALRDYLLTADARSLGDARVGFAESAEHLELAKALTRSDEGGKQQLERVEPLLAARVEFARKAVQVRQTGDEAAIRRLVSSQAGDPSPGGIKREILQLKREQQALLQDRDTRSYLQAQATRWTVTVGVGVNLVLLVFVGWLVRDDLRARRHAAGVLQAANEMLEARVAERTQSLQTANQALEQENLERQWQNQALEHQLRYNDLIIHSIDSLVLVTTKVLKITRLNPAVTHHLGFASAEMVGQPLQRYLRAGEGGTSGPAGLDPLLLALKEGREVHDFPGVLMGKSDRLTPVKAALFPLRDGDKVVGGVLTVRLETPVAV